MTIPARQPHPHCEHECVCWLYPDNFTGARDADACEADTRTHTSPPAPALFQIEPNSSKYSLEQIVEINENIQKQRKDAAKAAREQVAKELDTALNMAGEDKDYQLYNMKEVLRSLRQHSERGGE